MIDRHFLFTDEMVRRILSGEKTQTRRPLLNSERLPAVRVGDVLIGRECWGESLETMGGTAGRVLYRADGGGVMTSDEFKRHYGKPCYFHRSKFCDECFAPYMWEVERVRAWRPPIDMPRWAARIVRPITAVRVERVQDISEADAVAEGFQRQVQGKLSGLPLAGEGVPCDCGDVDCPLSARMEFACAWNTIYSGRGLWWDANPWVVVVEFEGPK